MSRIYWTFFRRRFRLPEPIYKSFYLRDVSVWGLVEASESDLERTALVKAPKCRNWWPVISMMMKPALGSDSTVVLRSHRRLNLSLNSLGDSKDYFGLFESWCWTFRFRNAIWDVGGDNRDVRSLYRITSTNMVEFPCAIQRRAYKNI